MSSREDQPPGATLRLHDLLGRVVVTATGHRLGRVVDCLTEPRGDALCVTTLLVGRGAWWARFGPARGEGGWHVRWEDIAQLAPQIRLRAGVRAER